MTFHALIYGGAGALGSTLVEHFKLKGWKTTNIDIRVNTKADVNIQIPFNDNSHNQIQKIVEELNKNESMFQAIICVAGGWQGGNIADPEFAGSVELMWKQSVVSSTITASIANQFLESGGLLVFTGAEAARSPTPGMIAYGMAKAAVHHLTKSLAEPNSGLHGTVIAILPITLDTPANRSSMPGSDSSSWTPLNHVAEKLYEFADNPSKVTNGKLITIRTSAGKTTFE